MFLTFSGTQPSIEISEWVQNILGLSNIIGSLLILGLPMAMYSFFLVQEREKSERLLLNIMPKEIADKLKQNDNLIAIENQSMSVLMADIVSFTKLANSISAEKLVDFLNKMFSDFDEEVEKFGVEKIKTVGDAYMVVSGLPRERNDHAQVLINVAQRFLEIAAEYEDHEGNPIELRIGINSGPAVSGVIGKSKFAFDVWGDTINTAARLESYGMPGKLHLSETTFNSLKEKPDVPIVREIEMKGKGLMKTYLI
jgi:class 3 adenylate cyclase